MSWKVRQDRNPMFSVSIVLLHKHQDFLFFPCLTLYNYFFCFPPYGKKGFLSGLASYQQLLWKYYFPTLWLLFSPSQLSCARQTSLTYHWRYILIKSANCQVFNKIVTGYCCLILGHQIKYRTCFISTSTSYALEHAYIKKMLIVYLKFRFNWISFIFIC